MRDSLESCAMDWDRPGISYHCPKYFFNRQSSIEGEGSSGKEEDSFHEKKCYVVLL